jgi:Putative prokaryotic signal transducing protein
MESEEPIAIYTLTDPTVAEMIRNALHEEGIVCEISGESQGGFSGVLEIQILTKTADAERARQIIAEMEQHHAESKADDEDEV